MSELDIALLFQGHKHSRSIIKEDHKLYSKNSCTNDMINSYQRRKQSFFLLTKLFVTEPIFKPICKNSHKSFYLYLKKFKFLTQ